MNNKTKQTIDSLGTLTMAVCLYTAAALKIYHLTSFSFYLTSVTFVPEPWRGRLAIIVPMTELCVALLLTIRATRRFGQFLAIIMMGVFIGFLCKMIADPYAPECTCFGLVQMAETAHKSNIVGVIRNSVLLAICLLAFICGFSASAKPRTKPWSMLGVTAIIAILLTAGIWLRSRLVVSDQFWLYYNHHIVYAATYKKGVEVGLYIYDNEYSKLRFAHEAHSIIDGPFIFKSQKEPESIFYNSGFCFTVSVSKLIFVKPIPAYGGTTWVVNFFVRYLALGGAFVLLLMICVWRFIRIRRRIVRQKASEGL